MMYLFPLGIVCRIGMSQLLPINMVSWFIRFESGSEKRQGRELDVTSLSGWR